MRTLMPHQQTALDWLREDREHVGLFMEMRLGKSLVAIRRARELGLARVLVLAPLTTLGSWKRELEAEEAPAHLVLGAKVARDRIVDGAGPGWYLLNYEGLRAHPKLAAADWDMVVADESTRIRNPQALTSKVCVRAFRHVRHRLLLSGNPAPESPLDYFQQFAFARGEFMGFDSYWRWRQANFQSDWNGWSWYLNPRGSQRLQLALREHALAMSRRSVHIGNAKVYEQRDVAQTVPQRRLTAEITKDLTAGDLSTKYIITKMVWLARVAGGFHPDGTLLSPAKTREIVSLLDAELRGEQVVVWFRFNDELRYTAAALRKAGHRVGEMTGLLKRDARERVLEDFWAGRTRVLCCQVKLGRYGLNLSCASTAIYYSNTYDAEDRTQSEDRVVHPTKSEPALVVDLVTQASIDEAVLDALRQKKVLSQAYLYDWVRSRYALASC